MRNLPRASHQGLCLGTSDIPRFLCWFLPWDWQPGLWWTRGRFFFVLVHMSQEGIWGWPLLMCLGAVKPHGYSLGFGFHVDSKIYRVLKQKILYVQKLWKSLLTHGINRKHFCPKLSWTELFFLTGFAEILLGSAGSKALATFFRNTLKQECSIIFFSISSRFSALPGKAFVFSTWCIYQIFWKMIHRVCHLLGLPHFPWESWILQFVWNLPLCPVLWWAVDALCLLWFWRTLEKFFWRSFVPNLIFLTEQSRVRAGCATGLVSSLLVITVCSWRIPVMTKLAGNSKSHNL